MYGTWMAVGGTLEDIRHDLEIIRCVGTELSLHLNRQKFEVISTNPATASPILSAIPVAQILDPASATFCLPSLSCCQL